MGAIAAWLAEHARQVLAWSLYLAAIVALSYAVTHSGVGTQFDSAKSSVQTRIRDLIDVPDNVVSALNGLLTEIQENDESGWGQLLLYMSNLDGISRCFRLITTNFQALVISMLALWAIVWRVLLAVFLFSKGYALAKWTSNGSLPEQRG